MGSDSSAEGIKLSPATIAVHGGERAHEQPVGSVVSPIFHSAIFAFENFDEMRRYDNAVRLSRPLSQHAKVARVYYPGLEDDPGHKLVKQQMNGFSGIVALGLSGSEREVEKLFHSLKLARTAPSLGGVETLDSCPINSSHVAFSNVQLKAAGVSAATVHFAVGIEAADDIIADITQSLDKI
jgi:cystathionine beta-lyase/cystathionine gamma-synthase